LEKQFCPEEYIQGLKWEETVGSISITKMCPNNQNEGENNKCLRISIHNMSIIDSQYNFSTFN